MLVMRPYANSALFCLYLPLLLLPLAASPSPSQDSESTHGEGVGFVRDAHHVLINQSSLFLFYFSSLFQTLTAVSQDDVDLLE